MAEVLCIRVVYALAEGAFQRDVELPAGSCVADAVAASGIARAVPEAVRADTHFGIYARRVTPDTLLRDGDRVEICRPLAQDPKQARRVRARGRDEGGKT